VGHAKAGVVAVRPRGQVLVALLVFAGAVAGGIALERGLGPAPVSAAPAGTGSSGLWLCPHGGGRDWNVTVHVSNPGDVPVTIRVRSLEQEKPGQSNDLSVDPGSTLGIPVRAAEPGSSTSVEYFGGWVAAGWTTSAGGADKGVAAEPCAPEGGRSWTLVDGTTEDGETASVVVMNPFASDAVFDVQILTEDAPPQGPEEWDDFVLRGRRSTRFEVNPELENEPAIGLTVRTSIGRVAAATLGISDTKDAAQPGIRSSLGWLGAPPHLVVLPGAGDTGSSSLTLANPGPDGSSFGVTLLGGERLRAVEQEAGRDPQSTASSTIDTSDPSSLVVRVGKNEPGLVAGRRTRGVENDLGSTTGAAVPAGAWIVMPSTGGPPQTPRIALANPGIDPVRVDLTPLPTQGEGAEPVRVRVQPGTTSTVGKGFLERDPSAAVLIEAGAGGVVPAGASYSEGEHGVAGYAVSVGLPIPERWIP
jgi:hypothetical protein